MSFGQLTRLNLLIFLSIVIGKSLSQQCHLQEFQLVNDRQVLNLSSPNFPNAYPPGTNCRYRIVAPMDYVVVASCRFEVVCYINLLNKRPSYNE